MLKIFILVSSLNFSDSLPSNRDSLFNSLRTFHRQQTEIALIPFEVKEKRKWLKWLPQIGFGYNAINDRIRPSINYSFAQIFQNINAKEIEKGKVFQIVRSGELAFKTDSFHLVALLKEVDATYRELKALEVVEAIGDEEYREQEVRNKQGEILPIEWLRIKKEHAKSMEAVYEKLESLDRLIIQVFELARM